MSDQLGSQRFLIFTQYFPPEIGASQSRLATLARSLTKVGHRVEVVTALPHHLRGGIFPDYRGRFYRKELWDGITIHRTWVFASAGSGVVRRLLNYASFMVTSLFGLFKAERADFIVIESPPIFLAVPGNIYSAVRRVPVILNVADLWPESAQMLGVVKNKLALRLASALESWAYRRARYINALTNGIAGALSKRGVDTRGKVLLFLNGADSQAFQPTKPDPDLISKYGLEGKKVFIFTGTHGLVYRLDLLIEIAPLLEALGVVFMLIGNGPSKQSLLSQAARLNAANVLFLDPQPEEQLPRYFSVAYASAIPLAANPLFEGTRPAKIFPSLACAVPIVYAGDGEGAALIRDAGAGIVVPPENAKLLTEAIIRLCADPTLRNQLGANGRSLILTTYDWGAIVSRWLAELSLLEMKRKEAAQSLNS